MAKRISDYIKELPTHPTEDIIDKDMIFHDFKVVEGKKGPYMRAKVEDPQTHNMMTVLIGGKVVMEKLTDMKIAGNLPIVGCIFKTDDYYDIK